VSPFYTNLFVVSLDRRIKISDNFESLGQAKSNSRCHNRTLVTGERINNRVGGFFMGRRIITLPSGDFLPCKKSLPASIYRHIFARERFLPENFSEVEAPIMVHRPNPRVDYGVPCFGTLS